MGRMDADWIMFNGKLKRSMWPVECAEWAARELGVAATPAEFESPVMWLAILLERSTDREATVRRLLAALDDAPEGTFTDDDWVQEHRAQAREYDKWSIDQAEGLGRREGRRQ